MDSDDYDAIMAAGSSPIQTPTADPGTASASESSRSLSTSGNPGSESPTPGSRNTSHSTSHRKRTSPTSDSDEEDDPSASTAGGRPLKRLQLEEDTTQYFDQVVSASNLKLPSSLDHMKTFLEDPSGLQRGLLYGAILALNERDMASNSSKGWEISSALQKNIRVYGGAMMLAPGLGAYKVNAAKSLIGLLQMNSLEGLPPHTDRAKTKILSGRCSTVLGEWRNHIKQKIVESMDDTNGKSSKDIGELCDELVKGTDIVITIHHHARIAWLRTLLRTKKARNDSKFWDEVDACLRTLRKDNDGDQVKISKAFSKALKADHQKYGKATASLAAGTPDWQRSIEKTAVSLVPFKK